MDYFIANDLHDLRQGEHLSYLVNKEGYQDVEFHSPEDIYNKTHQLMLVPYWFFSQIIHTKF